MDFQFPKTLRAARATEASLWAIGDALLAETEDRTTGPRSLKAVAKELEENGIEYSTSYLGSLRNAAEAFPPNRRHPLPFKVHSDAGNPDTLDVIVRAAKKTGDKVTRWYVIDALKQQRNEMRAERTAAKADAVKEKAKAESDEREARRNEREAKSEAERTAAARKREAAAKRRREADDKVKHAKVMPRKKDRAVPDEDDVPMMVVTTKLMAAMSEAEYLATRAEKELGKVAADLSPKMIAGLTEAAMSAANAWTRVAAVLRKVTPRKGSHLSVVNQ